MKVVLVIALILLMLLVGLPTAMGHMGDCPACTSAKAPFALGICAGVLSAAGFILLMSGSRFRLLAHSPRRFLLAASIFRPPRSA
jgi:hypothetical protein